MAAHDERLDALTPREREVLDLVRRGLTNEEIAQHLDITLDGAEYHVSQILSKLQVNSREEAAALAEPRGWPWGRLAGAAVVAAALAGVAVLAWSVLANGSETTEVLVGLDPRVQAVLEAGEPVAFKECGSNREWVQPSFDDVVTHPYLTGFHEDQVRQVYDQRFFMVVGDGAISANRGWVVASGLEGDEAGPPWPLKCPVRNVARLYLLYHEATDVRRLGSTFAVRVRPIDQGYTAINFSPPLEDAETGSQVFVLDETGPVLGCLGSRCSE